MLKKINKKKKTLQNATSPQKSYYLKYELLLNESSLSSTSLNCSIVSKSCTCQN